MIQIRTFIVAWGKKTRKQNQNSSIRCWFGERWGIQSSFLLESLKYYDVGSDSLQKLIKTINITSDLCLGLRFYKPELDISCV